MCRPHSSHSQSLLSPLTLSWTPPYTAGRNLRYLGSPLLQLIISDSRREEPHFRPSKIRFTLRDAYHSLRCSSPKASEPDAIAPNPYKRCSSGSIRILTMSSFSNPFVTDQPLPTLRRLCRKISKLMQAQMHHCIFDTADPIAIPNFKTTCYSNELSKGFAMWIFYFFIRNLGSQILKDRTLFCDS